MFRITSNFKKYSILLEDVVELYSCKKSIQWLLQTYEVGVLEEQYKFHYTL